MRCNQRAPRRTHQREAFTVSRLIMQEENAHRQNRQGQREAVGMLIRRLGRHEAARFININLHEYKSSCDPIGEP